MGGLACCEFRLLGLVVAGLCDFSYDMTCGFGFDS